MYKGKEIEYDVLLLIYIQKHSNKMRILKYLILKLKYKIVIRKILQYEVMKDDVNLKKKLMKLLDEKEILEKQIENLS